MSQTHASSFIPRSSSRHGLTLLELLVVVAILAAIAGAALVAYDGLASKGARGVAAHGIRGVDQALRTFKVVTGALPTNFDVGLLDNTSFTNPAATERIPSVLNSTTNLLEVTVAQGVNRSATAGGMYPGLHPKLIGTDTIVTPAPQSEVVENNVTADGKFSFWALEPLQATALINAGVTKLRYINDTKIISALGGSSANLTVASNVPQIPNRVFDDETRGFGVSTTVASGLVVTIIESMGNGAVNSSRLKDIAGLAADKAHIVVALGVGNNCSLISKSSGANSVGMAEAPYYADVEKDQYGRYFVLLRLASDTNGDGEFGTVASGETLEKAEILSVFDSKGDWLDEEYAEFSGQKP